MFLADELISCDENQTVADFQRRETHWIEIANIINQPLLIKNGTTPKKWTLYNSFFVAMTVASTIGYGHMAPASAIGRFFCMVFALFGIPLNGILLANLADCFGSKLIRESKKRPVEKCTACLSLIIEACLYLVPGFVVFLAIPAAVFSFIEEWCYGDSLYYAFITLTTIGFGDLIAGLTNVGDWTWLYRSFVVVWIFFGLGYLLMVINIITRGLRSGPVLTLEKKMASRIRATRHRMAKDAKLLHNLVNEIRVLNIKPVYKKEQSEGGPAVKNSWLTSSYIDLPETSLECQRWSSESALDAIDRDATFQQSELQPNQVTVTQNVGEWLDDDPLELLSRLATALIEDTIELDNSEEGSDDDVVGNDAILRNSQIRSSSQSHEYPAMDVERGSIGYLKRNLSRKCSFSPSFSMLRQQSNKLQRKLSIQTGRQYNRAAQQQRSVSESCSLPYKKQCDDRELREDADATDVTDVTDVAEEPFDVEQPLQSQRYFRRRNTEALVMPEPRLSATEYPRNFRRRNTEANVLPEPRLSAVEFCKTLQQVQTNRLQFNNESSI